MTDPAPGSSVPGRGAWTKAGHSTGSAYYLWSLWKPRDGSTPQASYSHRAVHLGVLGIEHILTLCHKIDTPGTGYYGPTLRSAVRQFQTEREITADGVVGPRTATEIWRPLIGCIATEVGVPAAHLYGMSLLESGFDPAAVGSNGFDSGLCQINLSPAGHGGDVLPEQAFDPLFAYDWTARRLAGARVQFGGKGDALQTACSIAQHNSPVAAQQWYANGTPPTETIRRYVELVLSRASGW